jgi:DNA-binding NarL/FixJ family response regulator
MSKKTIAVAVVEDARGTRESLVTLLSRTPGLRCIGAFASGEDAGRDLPALLPEVVLMDINLPGMNGIKCVAQLKQKLPRTQFLMLTSYEDCELIFESLKVGASGYLMKNQDPDEIALAVQQVHAGGSPMSMNIARKVVTHFQQIKQPSSDMEKLTEREHEVLALLAKGFMYKEIGDQLGISLHTVRGHVHLVYEKLHVQSRTEAVLKYLGQK